MSSRTRDYFHLHFIVLLWGFTALLGLLVSISPEGIVLYRTLGAGVLLAVLLLIRRKSFLVSGKNILRFLLAGVLIAAHWFLFFLSARISNIAVCMVGISTGAFWTSLLEPISFGKKLKPIQLLTGLMVIIGIGIIYKYESVQFMGLVPAVISAVFSSVFTIMNEQYVKENDPFVITFYEMLGACAATLLFIFFEKELCDSGLPALMPNSNDFIWLFILAAVCTVYAYSASVNLLKRISAFAMTLAVNMEPVYAIVLGYIFFGERERMSLQFYMGGALILLSVISYPILTRRYKRS